MNVAPTNSGTIVQRLAHVVIGCEFFVSRAFTNLANNLGSTYGPFFVERPIDDFALLLKPCAYLNFNCLSQLQLTVSTRFATTDDRRIARFAAPTSEATLGQLAGRTDRMPPTLRSTFTTTVRVIVWVHRGTANVRPPALPSVSSGLADTNRIVFRIPHFADRRTSLARNTTNFTTG
jgi:hypothetical protein